MQKETVRVATNQPGVFKNLKTGKYDVKYRGMGFYPVPPLFLYSKCPRQKQMRQLYGIIP